MTRRLSISQRLRIAPPSPVRKLVPLADNAKEKGIRVYHLNIGDPDFTIPQPIKKALKNAANSLDMIPYANSRGQKDLINAWRKYYQDSNISLDENEIIITNGSSEGLIFAIAGMCDVGDEVLVFEPFYANYVGFANLVSAKIVAVSLNPTNGFHLPSEKEIAAKITPRTKAIIFTNPNNPTGTVFTKEEITMMLRIAERYNVFLIGDEAYRGIAFDGKESFSLLHVASEKQKQYVVIVDSVSKKLNMCGARVGALISHNTEFIEGIFRFTQARLSSPFLEQKILVPMLQNCTEYIAWLAKEYQNRRNVFLQTLEEKMKITIHPPEGAFYTMVKLPVANTEEFARWLLTDFSDHGETVMVAPGAGFYQTAGRGKDEVRIAYVLDEKKLERAAELLAKAVKRYAALKK